MNGKQLFCLSLILLSIAMGLHWNKNKPKPRPKQTGQKRVALNIDDLQLRDNPDSENSPSETGDEEGDDQVTDPAAEPEDGEDTAEKPIDSTATASAVIASATEQVDELGNDPIIASLRSIPRNPFETSPYSRLVEEIRALRNLPEDVEIEKKSVKLLNANFSATIATRKELVAVIDSRLYRKGELFQDKKITEIKNEIVSLEQGNDLFILPKVGVNVTVAEDGTYTVEDNFHKN